MSPSETLTIVATDGRGLSASQDVVINWTGTVPSRTTVPYVTGLVDRDAQVYRAGLDQVIQWTIPDVCPVPGGAVDCTIVKNRMATADRAGGRRYRGRPQSGVLLNDAWMNEFGKVTNFDPQDGHAYSFANTCNPAYQTEMDRVDQAMAAQLDGDPRMVEIMAIHRFGFQFSNELMIHNPGDARNKTALASAGWTQVQDQKNILALVPKVNQWWKQTHTITWCSTFYQNMSTSGLDVAFTNAYMALIRSTMPDAVIGINNSDLNAYGQGQPSIYLTRKAHGSPGEDQTATEAKIGGAAALLRMFSNPYLATMVAETRSQEMPQGWEKDLTLAQINTAQAAFEAAYPLTGVTT